MSACAHAHTHIHTHAHAHTHTYERAHTSLHALSVSRTHTRIHAHTDTHTHTQIHTHVHTYAHTDIFRVTGCSGSDTQHHVKFKTASLEPSDSKKRGLLSTLQHAAIYCAVHCGVLQCAHEVESSTTALSLLPSVGVPRTSFYVLQQVAVCCGVLRCTQGLELSTTALSLRIDFFELRHVSSFTHSNSSNKDKST